MPNIGKVLINNTSFSFFIFLCAEVFLTGSGQDLHILGPLTLRMLNFAIAALLGIVVMFKRSLPLGIFQIILCYTLTIALSTCIGFFMESGSDLIFMDIKMFLSLFAFPFLYYCIKDHRSVIILTSTFLFCLKLMILAYLVYMLIVYFLKLIPFDVVYLTLNPLDSIQFRETEGAMFYKGFLFLPIASVAFIINKNPIWFALSAFAIFLTFTRGFYVIFFCGILFNFIMSRKMSFSMIMGLTLLMLIIYIIVNVLGLFEVSEDRVEGDAKRILTLQQVWDEVNPFSFIVGHGFGHGVPIRKEHMEMSFLEIIHKQGILGLVIWSLFFFRIIKFWRKTSSIFEKYSRFYVIALILVYIQSLFNPYLTNAIGITMVMLSYLSCYRLYLLSQMKV